MDNLAGKTVDHTDQPPPSRRSQAGLDWFAFFLADIQTGWGPFVAVYLASLGWAQLDIGLMLTFGTLATLALQIPAGAMVDAIPAKRAVAGFAVLAISGSALLLALWPEFVPVLTAKFLHAVASCLVGPALAAISLGLVGHGAFSVRLGRNTRFLSLGNALAAGAMGAIGWYFSNRAIFWFTASLAIPTLIALTNIRGREIDVAAARGGAALPWKIGRWSDTLAVIARNPPLLIFAAIVVLFQLGNAAMMPILAGTLTVTAPEWATIIVAGAVLGPQFVVAAIAPSVGRVAEQYGRRVLLVLCMAALTVRGLIFAGTTDPWVIITAQLLDGLSAATLGVLVPLVTADVTRGSGHYNFALGVVGAAVGIGASASTALAGWFADTLGSAATFLFLAGFAGIGLLLAFTIMPETRDTPAATAPGPAT